jgi:hypothetical protein
MGGRSFQGENRPRFFGRKNRRYCTITSFFRKVKAFVKKTASSTVLTTVKLNRGRKNEVAMTNYRQKEKKRQSPSLLPFFAAVPGRLFFETIANPS